MEPTDVVRKLAAAFCHQISKAQAEAYLEELSRWPFDAADWARLYRLASTQCEKFPTLQQLYGIRLGLEAVSGEDPKWITWRDPEGRSWAKRA